jgi:hypothetical protein
MVNRAVLVGISALLFSVQLPTHAETCTPLSLVGGQGSEVTKTVSGPTLPGPFGIKIKRNNWNTDWAVPGGRKFSRFVATRHWYRLARSYKRCNTRGSTNQANLE